MSPLSVGVDVVLPVVVGYDSVRQQTTKNIGHRRKERRGKQDKIRYGMVALNHLIGNIIWFVLNTALSLQLCIDAGCCGS